MPLTPGIFSSSLGRRLLIAMTAVAAGVLLAAVASAVRDLRVTAEQQTLQAVTTQSASYSRELRARLAASELVVQTLVANDAGAAGAQLRARLLRSEIIHGVVLLPADKQAGPVLLSEADHLALSAGRTLLRSGARTCGDVPLYLVHSVRAGGLMAVACFELSPEWLWQGREDMAAAPSVLAVYDEHGTLLTTSDDLPVDVWAMFAPDRAAAKAPPPVSALRSWTVGQSEWRGAAATILPEEIHLEASRWTVIASRPAAPLFVSWSQAAGLLPLPLLCAALLILALGVQLQRRWEPVLQQLSESLRELALGSYQRVPLEGAGEAPRAAAQEFNRTIAILQDKMRAMESLNDIDRMLLESVDLESCLDELLERVRSITGSDSAMLVLLDRDASEYGRAYLTAPGEHAPVSRINLDTLLLSQLTQERAGLTVARFEPGRHSVLEPLHVRGAEFFWLWPVLSQEHISAVLAVGYAGVPQVAAEVAGFGTECAARIGVALSNSARGEQLYHQAHHDQLTGLPNRLLFRDRLSQELASAADGHQRGALMYVDLDHFKKINDTVGHNGGDQVLQIVAQRLRACIKEVDTVARLGGDEFTLILRNVGTAESAHRIASRVSEALQEAVNIGGRDHHVGASIGITLFPDDATVLDELMRNADLAMYRAKSDGRARVVFYNREMQRMPALVAESGLHNALQRREFSLYYQPQYALGTGKLSGLEALLRWQPPREAMRYPGQFVPAAEQSGLIVDIGAWVLEAGCEQMAEWSAAKVAPPRLALNVSVFQLRQPDFHKLVRRTLERTGVAPDRLEFELTESVFADEDALATLHKLSALGVYLSLDDFGTGYSSLGYLRAHPVQSIKIDRSFIEEVATNLTAATLAETMITMAHALGKKVVAEGVETMQQLEFLRERRCDFAQGFFLARPAATSDITALLQGLSDTSGEDFRATA